MIKQRYEALSARVDALSLRERGMLFVGVAAVLFMLWNLLLMAPLEERQRALLEQNATLRDTVASIDQQIVGVMKRHNDDPNQKEIAQLRSLDRQLEAAERQISHSISGLVAPEAMARLLEQVLASQEGLSFVSLENLGREALIDVESDSAQKDAPGIYKHIMRLEVEGSYAQLLSYLRELETLDVQFRWDEVSITMLDYPRANIVITVHTLSMQEGWVSV